MDKKEKVSELQIAFMVMLFEIGSTPLFLVGGKAKQDSWLAMLTGAVFGFLLLMLFFWLQRSSPKSNLIELLQTNFGKIAGTVIGITYSLYFAYESMRNVRDLGELASLTLLKATPISITMLVFVLVALYAIWKGTEVVFRLPEVLLPMVLGFYALMVVMLGIMGLIDFKRLLPMFDGGFKPVLHAALPDVVSFPFGQMLVFLMMWCYWEKPGVPVKATAVGYILISLFLVFMNAINIAVLGPSIAGFSQLPFLMTARTLAALRFIERADILVTVQLYLGLLIKMMVFYFCSVKAMSGITGKSAKLWVFPVGLAIYASSFLERDYTEHISIGLGPSLKIDPVFQVLIPLLLALSILLRSRRKRKGGGEIRT
ncbi:endospore germination permease [Paenibacillus sp. NFR01]|uniref:GerAB/ArcD/ProY family transporter n=1 Tax=Paenibacillus sp. NFR01 TaxID=1566279 RepID=UPI0008AD41A7|nr:endospore germination permease [Paenibacillus sp. NFR01]SET97467.1 spore germination protein KB [Paenibacillus sp. NFR01]